MNKHEEMVIKTRKNILDSFIELWKENGLESITIGAITKKAHLNRGTFYKYFNDIYDLIDQLENDTIMYVKEEIDRKFHEGRPADFNTFSANCAEIFEKNQDTILLLLNLPSFTAKLKHEMLPVFMANNPALSKVPYPEYLEVFIFSTMIEMLKYWYQNDKEMDLKQMFRITQSLVLNGVLSFTDKTNYLDMNQEQ